MVEMWNSVSGPEWEEYRAEQIVEEIQARPTSPAAERGELESHFRKIDQPAFLGSLQSSNHHNAGRWRTNAWLHSRSPQMTRFARMRSWLRSRFALGEMTVPRFQYITTSVMAESTQSQIFQRSFTTKPGPGHGIGIFSVKILTGNAT
jgi:hypothetical protein